MRRDGPRCQQQPFSQAEYNNVSFVGHVGVQTKRGLSIFVISQTYLYCLLPLLIYPFFKITLLKLSQVREIVKRSIDDGTSRATCSNNQHWPNQWFIGQNNRVQLIQNHDKLMDTCSQQTALKLKWLNKTTTCMFRGCTCGEWALVHGYYTGNLITLFCEILFIKGILMLFFHGIQVILLSVVYSGVSPHSPRVGDRDFLDCGYRNSAKIGK